MKIFLLDDESSLKDDFTKLAQELIDADSERYQEVEVISTRSLKESRELLFGNSNQNGQIEEFDIFFLDYYLEKGESGIDIIKEIREKTEKPIVMLTNHDDAKIAFEAGELGATLFCLKEELISTINLKKIIEEAIDKEAKRHKN